MDLEGARLSEISKTKTCLTYCMISLICRILKDKNKLINSMNRLVVVRGGAQDKWVKVVKGTNFQL